MDAPTFLTDEELNHTVHRYLVESGFAHSAFAFAIEAGIKNSSFDSASVPATALIEITAMGLQYKEMLANIKSANEDDFIFLKPMDLITKEVTVLQEIVKGKLGTQNVAGPNDSDEGQEGARSREIVKDKNVAGPSDSGKRNEGVSSLGKNKVGKAPETLPVPVQVEDPDELRKRLKKMNVREKRKATRAAFFLD